MISDIKMPQVDGMEVLRRVKAEKPTVPVIMITAYASVKQAVEALRLGAMDYIMKPFDIEEIKVLVANGLEHRRLLEENKILQAGAPGGDELREHDRQEPADAGGLHPDRKSGGHGFHGLDHRGERDRKELAARAIHANSRRRDRACFDQLRGAAGKSPGKRAFRARERILHRGDLGQEGMFETAHAGTIFLDEVGETSPWTQVKLFRVLQERMIRRVGGNEEIGERPDHRRDEPESPQADRRGEIPRGALLPPERHLRRHAAPPPKAR